MLTCPCNVDPLTPQFHIVKFGFTGVYIIFYFCSKTLIVGTHLNSLNEVVLMCTHNLCFLSKNKKTIKIFLMKIVNFHFC